MTQTLKVKKLHPDAKLPTYATDGSAAFDIYALEGAIVCDAVVPVSTGLAFEVPQGWVLKLYSRSGHAARFSTRLGNCVGIVDSDYRGEVFGLLICDEPEGDFIVHAGDRIMQGLLEPVHRVSFQEVDDLSETARSTGGLGSTGA